MDQRTGSRLREPVEQTQLFRTYYERMKGEWHFLADRKTRFGKGPNGPDPKKWRPWLIVGPPKGRQLPMFPDSATHTTGLFLNRHKGCEKNCKVRREGWIQVYDRIALDVGILQTGSYSCREKNPLILAMTTAAADAYEDS